ncbi:protein O-mannosyl-transferase family [Rosettibacter firmus]|uniref:protein O-mannosyl-transferase family n=1 Tax=Rosettibacter firmus TaxID=3111522 RepID=UPI00336BDF08
MLAKSKIIGKYYAELAGLVVFLFYLLTLAPSVIQIDSGELAAVQATLGIAHPTGYPIFTILGYMFLKIPLPFTKIYLANLFASIWCAAGIIFFIKSIKLILSNSNFNRLEVLKRKKKKENKNDKNINNIVIIISLISGLFLAFSKTYWFQSTSVEVYSLQIFLFNLIIYLTLKSFYKSENNLYGWIGAGIAIAFGFANHMTTLLVLPFPGILFLIKEKNNGLKKFGVTLIISVVILSLLYLYLPVRASNNPELNWGNPINFENFWRHFTGKQYQVWLFSSFDSAKKQLSYYIQNLPDEFAYVGLVLIFLGLYEFFLSNKKLFYVYLITFLFALLYTINYDIVDIDSYFLLTYIILISIAAYGIKFIFEKLNNINYSIVISVVFIIILFVKNYSKVNQSDVYTFEDYTRSILNSVGKNSIILTYQWDYFVSPSYYFQYVENERKDVVVIDKELLRRSWYYNQIERNNPDVLKNLKSDINNFLLALKPFERSESYDSQLLEKYYQRILTGLISQNIDRRDFYIGLELIQNEMQRGEFKLPDGYQVIPHLFLFKVVKGNEYVPAPLPEFKIRFPENRNKYINFIENIVGTMLTLRAMYEIQYGKYELAKIYLSKIRNELKNFEIPSNILKLIENK